MKKLLCLTLCFVLVCTLFSGCHGSVERKTFAIPE